MPDPPLQQSDWAPREDQSQKGLGFLGPLKRPDGGMSSELSAGMEINGKEALVPLMVPTLSKQQVQYLLTTGENPDFQNATMRGILQKAADFARTRQAQGLPFFARPGEQYPVHPELPRFAVQMKSGDITLPNQSGQRDPRLGKLGYEDLVR